MVLDFGLLYQVPEQAGFPPRLGKHGPRKGLFHPVVDRPIYAPLVKMNINSLHLQNPNHRVAVYCDPVCHRALSRMRFFYPGQVVFNEYFKDGGSRPWQEKKLDVLKEAVKIGAALVDADTFGTETLSGTKSRLYSRESIGRYKIQGARRYSSEKC